jgi:hypothetical protein
MPRRGAAALNAASNWPSDSTPCGSPLNPSAERSAFSSPGVIRRKPVGAWAKPLRGASWALFSIAIVIPLSGVDRDGQASPVNGNGNFRLTETASFGYVGICDVSQRSPLKARHEF